LAILVRSVRAILILMVITVRAIILEKVVSKKLTKMNYAGKRDSKLPWSMFLIG